MSTRRFAPLPDSPARARSFTAETLESWGCAGMIDVAQLLVSELVTNVVLHAGTDAVLSLVHTPRIVRIEVTDGCPTGPQPCENANGDSNAVNGRGLPIVEVICDRWGVELRPGGKTVWTELELV